MSVHSWSLIQIDDDESLLSTRSLSTAGISMVQHVPNEQANQEGAVTESLIVLFDAYGDDTAAQLAQEVSTYLAQGARRKESGRGPAVYLTFSRLDESEVYRSPVYGGVIEWASDALTAYSSGYLQATIVLTRANWWERHDAEVQLGTGAMTNNGSSRLALDDPGGSLETPVRVELTNTTASIAGQNFFLAINSEADPGVIDLTLPGDTNSWSTAQVHNYIQHEDEFSAAELTALRGLDYHILVGLSSHTGDYFMKAWINFKVGAGHYPRDWTSGVPVTGARIYDLGVLALPPAGTGDGYGDLYLVLTVEDASGNTSGSYDIEWIQLMPASSFRKLKQTGFTAASGDKWVDDNITGQTYLLDASDSLKKPIFEGEGPPLTVPAGVASELLVVYDEDSTGVTTTNSFTATVYCRPRRLTL